jgi:hypothetical protein
MDRFRTLLFASVFFGAPLIVAGPLLNRRVAQERGDAAREILRAANFAAQKHKLQQRKNVAREPYILHPLRVSELVATVGNSSQNVPLLQAALMHDTVEDTATTFEEVENQFGRKVRLLVEEVSDDKTLPKDVRKRLQVENARTKSPEAQLLSLADKVANLEDLLLVKGGGGIPIGWSVERVQDYCAWASQVAAGMSGACEPLEERLRQMVRGEFEYTDGKRYPALRTLQSKT